MQHHAAKLLDGCKNLKYKERVTSLDLPSLAYRLAGGDVLRFTNLSTVTAQFSYQKNLSLAIKWVEILTISSNQIFQKTVGKESKRILSITAE